MPTKNSKKISAATDTVEWIIAAAGMLLLTAALGFIVYRAAVGETRPAELSVSVDMVERSAQAFRADFIVSNSGTETAAAAVIEGELTKNGESVEKSTATLTYVPGNSVRRGSLHFSNDPDQNEMKIRVLGFEKP